MSTIPKTLLTPAIKATAAGLGTAIGGPAGTIVGGFLGAAIFTPAVIALLDKLPEEIGAKAFEKFFEASADPILEALKQEHPRTLEQAYRDTLRIALETMQPADKAGYEEWFDHWTACLHDEISLQMPPLGQDTVTEETLDTFLANALVFLDAQQRAREAKSTSLSVDRFTRGPLPAPLFATLKLRLPALLSKTMDTIVVEKAYQPAFNTILLTFQRRQTAILEELKSGQAIIGSELREFRGEFQQYLAARAQGTVPALSQSDLYAELARVQKLNEELNRRLTSQAILPIETDVARLRNEGREDEAFQLQQEYVAKLGLVAPRYPLALYDLGQMYEARYDWPNAYAAYRKAWELESTNYDFGFKYANFAGRQLDFETAIPTLKLLLPLVKTPAQRARLLNNLGNLCSDVNHMTEAEAFYDEGLAIFRKLAESDPETFLPNVAAGLNNLGIFYRNNNRMPAAEAAHREALSVRKQLAASDPDKFLPDVAATLNNLGVFYWTNQHMQEAEQAYDEALAIRRKLAERSPQEFLPDVTMTLNNLGNLYSDTQRTEDAEKAFNESLAGYQKLAATNPEAFLPDVAMTFNNLGVTYKDSQRFPEAEIVLLKALAIRRTLCAKNPDAFLPNVANTLNNLGAVYCQLQRLQEGEEASTEALSIRKSLAINNPDIFLPDVAESLNQIAELHRLHGRLDAALQNVAESEEIVTPFWRNAPHAHADLLSQIGLTSALISRDRGDASAACTRAHTALEIALYPVVKSGLQKLIAETCPDPTPPAS